ncbi:hypothetical protein WME98_47045 [Sorangium sp. So ce296]|uniref:hypothetical protein n=1 Tax=Sorangium sp. So ce296 TaxID=3133296 RepID=UPI003F628302
MLAVDGLEEPGQHRRWRELLGELPVHLKRHPRLRVAVTLRTASREAILGRLDGDQLDWIEEVPLAERGDAQRLLPIYCEHHGVEAPGPRLRWAIREPLSVRLYCELRKEDPAWEPSRRTLALPNLLRKKLDLAEEFVREQLGLTSEKDTPLHCMLTAVTSAYVQGGPLRRDEAIARARAAMEPPELLSAKAWVSVLEHAENHGLLLLQTDEPETLSAPRTTYVEPAHEPLMDYLIAEQTSREVQAALARGEAPALRSPLTERPDALTQTAILLGQRGISLVGSGLWKNELPASELERLELRAIAALEGEAARAYHPWVLGRLTASMSSCRRVLAELCVPVARDEAHPFGPRFVHEALSLFAPIQRDLFWPGPSLLDEGGQPLLCGHRIDVALEELSIEPDDAADGPPLLLAWALTSLDRRWRRRLRVALARWGAGRLDELLRWLDLTIGTNDPQMVEDIAMVAFGAACLAGANPRLGALATWVDVHLLTPGSAHRREDIVVLHAARGIVERAVAVGVRVEESSLEHARLPYAAGEALLAIDAEAARKADDHEGIWPIEGALAWHVVPRAIEAFFQAPESTGARGRCLDPRVEHLLASHTSSAAVEALTPQRFAFGVIVAHLRDMGWDGAVGRNADELWARSPLAYADEADGPIWRTIALVRRAERAHDSTRKPIDTVEEKYVWTGCRMLQAYLAARVPSSSHVGQRLWTEPPVDPIMASMLEANPASDVIETAASAGVHWIGWADRHLVPTVLLKAHGQLDRANEWVQRAPEPDIGPWLQLPGHAVPPWAADASWLTLRRTAFTREPQSQAHSELHLWSGTVPSWAADLIEREEALRQSLRPSSADTLFGFAESVPALSYVDPSEATWAPWAAGVHEPLEIPSRSASGQGASIAVTPTTAMIGWESQRGESAIWMLAHWLRRSLKLTGVKRVRAPMSEEWRFHDLHGTVHAVYTWWGGAGPELHEALLMQRGSLARLLEDRGEVLVWGVRVLREPAGVLLPRHPDQEATCRWERRQFCWLSLLRGDNVHIFRFGESGEIAGVAPEPPALGSPASQESPGRLVTAPLPNPDHAVPLSSELDDENAIPYFLWDDPMPVHEVRRRLATASPPERDRLLGKILREARDPDVWRFTSPEEVAERFSSLSRQLGRRRAFWEFLLNRWHKEGLLEHQPA